MTIKAIKDHRAMIKRIGVWAGVRYLRNLGIRFEDAYEIIFGKPPRNAFIGV